MSDYFIKFDSIRITRKNEIVFNVEFLFNGSVMVVMNHEIPKDDTLNIGGIRGEIPVTVEKN